ncbi:hypothetical protein M9Y10_020075 [Tritrichomonas musculus]|uniref:Uncharacterized protein n=1 Tax=Tritrichomonas musculus TaxID=1915356 RepID=A0ABR2HH67_9EUKA
MALDAPILYDLISSKISDDMIDDQDDNITTINVDKCNFGNESNQKEINRSNIHVTKSNQAHELQENPSKKETSLQLLLMKDNEKI